MHNKNNHKNLKPNYKILLNKKETATNNLLKLKKV